MSSKPKPRLAAILLLAALSIPVAATLTWALLLALNVFLGLSISLDWAFGIVLLAALLAGPIVVTWLVLRQRKPRPNP